MYNNPLNQFFIKDLIILHTPIFMNFNLALTNLIEYLVISFSLIITISILVTAIAKVKTAYWSVSSESLNDTIHNIISNQINRFGGQIYFPFITTLFLFILINNLIGMIPYSFSVTSHFILTLYISFVIVTGCTILGFNKHNIKFFSLFIPTGCPVFLIPLLVLIELISYIARNISLGLRLGANILSGHMLLNILSNFTYDMMNNSFMILASFIPLVFIIAFSSLELAIALIQAQVFVVLSSGYIKDVIDLH